MHASLVGRSGGARGLAPATPGTRPVGGGGDLLFRHPARALPRAVSASSSSSSSPARLSSLIAARGGVSQAAAAAAAAAASAPPLSCRRRLCRRRWPGARASAAAPRQQQQPQAQQGDDTDLAAVEQAVERAAATLDELLQQVLGECVAEQAASFLRAGEGSAAGAGAGADDGWPSADTLEGIVRGAVAQRVEWLDDAFLAALDAFVVAIDGRRQQQQPVSAADADADADARLIEVLQLVRGEVLAQVSARLPPAVRVLDAALRETERRERIEVVERALLQRGGDEAASNSNGGLPRVSFEALASAAGQLVDDMEDAEAVPDRALLARLVLLREELRAMHARQAWGGGGGGEGGGGKSSTAAIFGFHRANLPRSCAAFAKELLAVEDGTRRAALLTKAFEEDWTGGAGGSSGGSNGGRSVGGGGGFGGGPQQQQKKKKKESPDVVRPGRFLATLHAMSAELEQRVRSSGGGKGGEAEEAERAAAVLRRMDDVRMEAVAVLDRMQRGGRGVASR